MATIDDTSDDDGLIVVALDFRALIEHDGREKERERQIHHGAHHEHLEPLPPRLREKFPGIAGHVLARRVVAAGDPETQGRQAGSGNRPRSSER